MKKLIFSILLITLSKSSLANQLPMNFPTAELSSTRSYATMNVFIFKNPETCQGVAELPRSVFLGRKLNIKIPANQLVTVYAGVPSSGSSCTFVASFYPKENQKYLLHMDFVKMSSFNFGRKYQCTFYITQQNKNNQQPIAIIQRSFKEGFLGGALGGRCIDNNQNNKKLFKLTDTILLNSLEEKIIL